MGIKRNDVFSMAVDSVPIAPRWVVVTLSSVSDAFLTVSVLVSESKHWSLMYNFPVAEKEKE